MGKTRGVQFRKMESVELIVVYDNGRRNISGIRWSPTTFNARNVPKFPTPAALEQTTVNVHTTRLIMNSTSSAQKWEKGAAKVRAAHAELMAM